MKKVLILLVVLTAILLRRRTLARATGGLPWLGCPL